MKKKIKKELKPKYEDKIIMLGGMCEFRVTYLDNAQNISQAVQLAGYYSKIARFDGTYVVEIFKQIH